VQIAVGLVVLTSGVGFTVMVNIKSAPVQGTAVDGVIV